MKTHAELNGGTINHISLTPEGYIKKEFRSGNGVAASVARRLVSELWSMKNFPFSPNVVRVDAKGIVMTKLDGDSELDLAIDNHTEAVACDIFRQAGKTLHDIHAVVRGNDLVYHMRHAKRIHNAVAEAQSILEQHGIRALAVHEALTDSYYPHEIDRLGLVWTHGDYWLNNFIGNVRHDGFVLTGIIDWEFAGMGSPYEDFAIVKMSIEDVHDGASEPFWKGYGYQPIPELQRHFAIIKTLEWMVADEDGAGKNYETPFYQKKLTMMREAL